MLFWNHRLVYLSTAGTLALIKNEMRDLHLDLRQFNDLMGIIGLRIVVLVIPTAAGFRGEVFDFCRLEHFLLVTFSPFLLFSAFLVFLYRGYLKRAAYLNCWNFYSVFFQVLQLVLQFRFGRQSKSPENFVQLQGWMPNPALKKEKGTPFFQFVLLSLFGISVQ